MISIDLVACALMPVNFHIFKLPGLSAHYSQVKLRMWRRTKAFWYAAAASASNASRELSFETEDAKCERPRRP